MNPTEIERLMLMSVKTMDDVAKIRGEYGISEKNFVFLYSEASFIFNYIKNFDIAPDSDTLSLEFPEFQYSVGSSNIDYIAGEFNKEIIRREVITTVATFTKPGGILEKDARIGITDLANKLDNIRSSYIEVNTAHRRALDGEEALNRYERYLDKLNGINTIETYSLGIEPIESIIECRRGNLIGLFADTGIGKSFLAVRIAAEFRAIGERVVVVSPELSVDELNYRCDSVLGYRLGYRHISNRSLLYGHPGPSGMQQDYKEFLDYIGTNEGWVNYDSSIEGELSVSAVEAIILNDKPTLLVVDGVYMMDDERRGKSGWESVENICKGLKKLATKHKIVILMTNHSNRDVASVYTLPTKREVANGLGFTRHSDMVITMCEVEGNEYVRKISVPKLRSNQQYNRAFTITWDADVGDIGRGYEEIAPATPDAFDY